MVPSKYPVFLWCPSCVPTYLFSYIWCLSCVATCIAPLSYHNRYPPAVFFRGVLSLVFLCIVPSNRPVQGVCRCVIACVCLVIYHALCSYVNGALCCVLLCAAPSCGLVCGALSCVPVCGALKQTSTSVYASVFSYMVPSCCVLTYGWPLFCSYTYTVPSRSPLQRDVLYPAKVEIPRLGYPDDQHKANTSLTSPAAFKARAMRILFLTNAHNGMSQALYLNLTEQGHQVIHRFFSLFPS